MADPFYILTQLRHKALEQKWQVQNQITYDGIRKITFNPKFSQTINGYLVLNGLEDALQQGLKPYLDGHQRINIKTLIRVIELNRTYIDNLKSDVRGIYGPTSDVRNETLQNYCRELKR